MILTFETCFSALCRGKLGASLEDLLSIRFAWFRRLYGLKLPNSLSYPHLIVFPIPYFLLRATPPLLSSRVLISTFVFDF